MSVTPVMIVDDHPLVRQGIRQLLLDDGRFQVVTEAASGYEAIQQADTHHPKVVLMDIQLHGLTGLHIAAVLKKRHPASHIIMLSSHQEDAQLYQAALAGAAAYLTKDVAFQTLVETIDRVMRGQQPILEAVVHRPDVATRILSDLQGSRERRHQAEQDAQVRLPLSLRELEVFDCIVHGYSNRDTADALFITEQTVKNHMTHILRKLGMQTRLDLVRHAILSGWAVIGSHPHPVQTWSDGLSAGA